VAAPLVTGASGKTIMAIDTTQLTDFTWAQIKLAAKHAMVSAAVGGASLSVGGKTIGRITVAEAKALYDMADAMQASEDAGENGDGNVLVTLGGTN
jgi:hypothetical protein